MKSRIDANLKKRDRAVQQWDSLDRRAIFYGLSHEEILIQVRELMEPIDKAPSYVRAYVSGYMARARMDWYQSELCYCHKDPATGKLYTLRGAAIMPAFCESVDPLYAAGRGAELAQWESKSYWIKASEREISFGRAPKHI
jgi:hypothetical protein